MPISPEIPESEGAGEPSPAQQATLAVLAFVAVVALIVGAAWVVMWLTPDPYKSYWLIGGMALLVLAFLFGMWCDIYEDAGGEWPEDDPETPGAN